MADDVQLNSGSGGDLAAADEIPAASGIKYQRVKITIGADGVNDGDVASGNPMPVDMGTNNDVTVQGEDAENAAASANPVQVGGRYDLSARTLGDGDVGAIALDPDGAVHISDGGNTITVDGTVTANPASGTIDTVTTVGTVTTITNDVNIADGGNVISVDDGASSLTVDTTGTAGLEVVQATAADLNVTEASAAGILADTNAIQTAVELIDNAVYVDDADWTDSSSSHLLVGGVYQSTEQTITDGDVGPFQVDSNGRLKVSIEVDNAGIGGGTQYAEDTAHNTGDTGTMALAVRNDTLAALAGTDGDYAPLQVDANGALYVNASSGAAEVTFGTDTYTEASSSGVNIAAVRNDTLAALANTDNEFAPLQVNASGALYIQEGAAMDVSAATVTVDLGANNDVTIDGSTVVLAEDAAFSGGNVMMAGAIRDDSLSALTPAEGDAVPLRVNSTGALHVTGGGGGTQYNIDDAGGATDTGTLALAIRDDSLTTLTPVDGDYVGLRVNSTGALHVTGGGGGTEYTEDVATANPIVGTATLMERDDALSTVTPIEGDWIGFRGTAEGALWTQDFNSDAILADTNTLAGAVSGGQMQVDIVADGADLLTNTNFAAAFGTAGSADTQVMSVQGIASMTPVVVDLGSNNDVTVTSGSITADLGANNDVTIDASSIVHAEDSAHTSTDDGIMALAVRQDAAAALTSASGDYSALTVGELGHLRAGCMAESFYRNIDANAEAAIKASPGILHWIHVMNMTAAVAYVHLYNATTASVTPGTTTPDLTLPIPTLGDTNGAGFNLRIDQLFDTAITLVVTTTTDGSTGDPGTNGVFFNAGYT